MKYPKQLGNSLSEKCPLSPEAVVQIKRKLRKRRAENGQKRTYSTQRLAKKLLEEPLAIKISLANALDAI